MNGQIRFWTFVASAFILGIALVVATFIAAQAFRDFKMFETSLLSVTGASQQLITSDAVKWRASFSRSAVPSKLADGYAAMKKDQDIVMKYLRDNGVKDDEINISPVNMSAITQNCGSNPAPGCVNDIVSYRLTQNVQINSSRVQQITVLARDPSSIINQGVVFSTGGLEYFYNRLPELRVQMLADATKDAQMRAQKIAESTGARVGRLVSVSSGVFQVQPLNSTQISNEGSYDTSTIEKQITAVVRASFMVE
jgi:hypothetical protein